MRADRAVSELRPAARSDWHLRESGDLAGEFGVDPEHGLPEGEAERRAERCGANELTERARRPAWRLLLDQFTDFMILVLIGAAVVSGLIGDLVDTLAILLIIVLNGLMGFSQAWRADRALAALKRLAAAQAIVLRNGQTQRVPAHRLVPGDIVLIEAGNQVAADMRLVQTARLRVDESSLTGESAAVEKHPHVLTGDTPALGDRLNMAFKGTTVVHGRGRGMVTAIGMTTELGKVADLMARGDERATPLQQRLAAFGKRLAIAVLGICAVIFGVGLLHGEAPVLMLMTAVSLAVAAIPEALPAIVTALLALGARRMVALNALVRRLPSVETLGSVTFICADKTGTLTQNRMTAEELSAGGHRWRPARDGAAGPLPLETVRGAALCNDAARDGEGHWQGDPTETALTQLASEAGLEKAELDREHARVHEFPFDSQRKRMTTLHRTPLGVVGYTKGAPESVVPRCTTQWHPHGAAPIDAAAVMAAAQEMASRGLRVLAVARRDHAAPPDPNDLEAAEAGLSLLGLIGLIDPPREAAAQAVRDCITAGITPVMITGDHPGTALVIARRLGIAAPAVAGGAAGADDDEAVLTGAELAALDDAALRERVRAVRVYARVDPAQKTRIVEALQSHGEFVAMTGDGVNDAPALKRADIGVAMGLGGTEVAREAASLVLLDDNFVTIVAAVREGRRIYDNIRKFVRYAMTGNSGEIWTIFLAPLVGLPIPLLPIQILWINLVTDGLPGLALAAEPAERHIMSRPPRPPGESLFARGMWQHILLVGLLIGALCLAVQAWAHAAAPAHAQTMVFTTLTLAQMAHVMAIRSESESLWRLGLRSNLPLLGAVGITVALQLAMIYVPWLQPVFKTQALSALELTICLLAPLVVVAAVELEKMGWQRRADGRR